MYTYVYKHICHKSNNMVCNQEKTKHWQNK